MSVFGTILSGIGKVSDFISGLGGLGESVQSASHALSPNTWLESVGLGKYTSDYKANAEREDSYFSRLAQSAEDAGYSPQAVLGSSLSNGTSANSSADYTNALGYQSAMNALAIQQESLRSNKLQNDVIEYNLDLSKESGLRTTDTGKVAQIVELINSFLDNVGVPTSSAGTAGSVVKGLGKLGSIEGSSELKDSDSWFVRTSKEYKNKMYEAKEDGVNLPTTYASFFANMFANLLSSDNV